MRLGLIRMVATRARGERRKKGKYRAESGGPAHQGRAQDLFLPGAEEKVSFEIPPACRPVARGEEAHRGPTGVQAGIGGEGYLQDPIGAQGGRCAERHLCSDPWQPSASCRCSQAADRRQLIGQRFGSSRFAQPHKEQYPLMLPPACRPDAARERAQDAPTGAQAEGGEVQVIFKIPPACRPDAAQRALQC